MLDPHSKHYNPTLSGQGGRVPDVVLGTSVREEEEDSGSAGSSSRKAFPQDMVDRAACLCAAPPGPGEKKHQWDYSIRVMETMKYF